MDDRAKVTKLEQELRAWSADSGLDISKALQQHIATGIRRVYGDGGQRFYDPFFAYGSERNLDVVFNDGARFAVEMWGNVDGAGIVEHTVPAFVPMVADVLAAMRVHAMSQDAAVAFLGGIS